MAEMPAKEATSKLGHMLAIAQSEPVVISKLGRDVAVVITPEHYRMLLEVYKKRSRVNPAVEAAHARLIVERGPLFAKLAKS